MLFYDLPYEKFMPVIKFHKTSLANIFKPFEIKKTPPTSGDVLVIALLIWLIRRSPQHR